MTGRTEYLSCPKKFNGARGAIQFFEEIEAGYLDRNEGGVFWNAKHTYKATISNSLYIELAISLFEVTGDAKYHEAAVMVYTWLFMATEIISEEFEVQDGVREGNDIDPKVWTYNPGVLIGALSKLYKITGGAAYLEKAVEIAGALMKR